MTDLVVRASGSCPGNTLWYVCAKGGYRGCCSVDPCTVGFCAEDSSSASASATESTAVASASSSTTSTTSTTTAAEVKTSTSTSTSSTSTQSPSTTATTTRTQTPNRNPINGKPIIASLTGGILALLLLAAFIAYSIHRSRKRRRGQFKLLHWRRRGSFRGSSKGSLTTKECLGDDETGTETKEMVDDCRGWGGRSFLGGASGMRSAQAVDMGRDVDMGMGMDMGAVEGTATGTATALPVTGIATPTPAPTAAITPPRRPPAHEVSPLNERDRLLVARLFQHDEAGRVDVGVSPLGSSADSSPAVSPPRGTLRVKLRNEREREGERASLAGVRMETLTSRAQGMETAELSDTGFYRQRAELPARSERELINVPGRRRRGLVFEEEVRTGEENETKRIVTADGAVMVASIQTVGGDEVFG
ncbi:uncharacterized protein BO97DRAFT_62845 [Aspergillus homomorphus CBS 101889]|uniref:Uncharacterized protein n=1 Tax=Aspergillus homomorphus (strain CBS 101889) TaxID=1450537 RepID=A0A395HZD4_ASPHC|nr:hypothetical protein BO97DRAFT_62845 [Aspergillus homomorphus CBS 101889]RAL12228.1 hypothetical protein BO97DRAFT_62845 [Aspergillus homomorphus CBS 101889]